MTQDPKATAHHNGARRVTGGRGAVVPTAEIRTYYDQPVIKEPVWTWEIPWYFWVGGISGASAVLSAVATLAGRRELAGAARRVASVALAPSPALLVADLGRPERFHHMLRVFRPTSPMSVGSWTLVAYSGVQFGASALAELGWLPRLRALADVAAGVLGTVMATYTAVLFADTAVPVWHEARRTLPFVFAASAAAGAGAATSLVVRDDMAPTRLLTVGGSAVELIAVEVMRRRLGALGDPYELDDAGRFARTAKWATLAGALATLLGGRHRLLHTLGALLTLGGTLAQRWAVYRAGFISARDPKYTVGPQRARVDSSRTT